MNKHNRNKSISIFVQNVRSIYHKIESLSNHLHENNLSVAIFTESWLNKNTYNIKY